MKVQPREQLQQARRKATTTEQTLIKIESKPMEEKANHLTIYNQIERIPKMVVRASKALKLQEKINTKIKQELNPQSNNANIRGDSSRIMASAEHSPARKDHAPAVAIRRPKTTAGTQKKWRCRDAQLKRLHTSK